MIFRTIFSLTDKDRRKLKNNSVILGEIKSKLNSLQPTEFDGAATAALEGKARGPSILGFSYSR